jgi:hypothetical protein
MPTCLFRRDGLFEANGTYTDGYSVTESFGPKGCILATVPSG